MHVTGIIAEYNPFHNGHAYHLAKAREKTGADFIVIVMSGNFVQRGTPALLDKFTRARMALLGGADLVLELPALWSTASAEYFARAGVSLLQQLGCVDALCYGCETDNAALLADICGLLNDEPDEYRARLFAAVKSGLSYAKARETALVALFPESVQADVRALVKSPNNILALEYGRAVSAHAPGMRLCPVARIGEGYHSADAMKPLSSASAIRHFLYGQPASVTAAASLSHAMPDFACRLLDEYRARYPLPDADDLSGMLHYCLLRQQADGYAAYADCTDDFSNKICRLLSSYTGYDAFLSALKSKDMAYTRISRCLLHILLDIRQSDYAYWRARGYLPYARVLGFCRTAKPLLSHIQKNAALPLLMRAADIKKFSGDEKIHAFFQKQLFADAVYRGLLAQKGGHVMPDEYRQQLIVV